MTKFELRLVDGWKKAWKWGSVQAIAAGLALQGAWSAVPADMKQSLPESVVTVLTVLVLTFGFVARFFTTAPRPDDTKGDDNAAPSA